MHEMSLVRSLLSHVEAIVQDHQAESVEEVCVEIGPLSGVEIELVKSAFAQLVGEASQANTAMTVREAPLVIHCRDCDRESELVDFVFRCLTCGSGRVRIVRGDEFRLVSVTLRESPAHV